MPRGMVEFWVDPESPYYKSEVFDQDKRFAFYCNRDWRSALATEVAQRIGLERVCHVEGGYTAWKQAGGPTEVYERRRKWHGAIGTEACGCSRTVLAHRRINAGPRMVRERRNAGDV